MGNSISHKQLHASATGKVILSDGSVHQFNKPLTVAELMLEHPQQVVVEFGAAVSEKRPTPLPADMKLDKKKIYLMLPMKRGKPVSLSSQEIHGHPGQACALPNKESCAERTSNSKYMPQFDLPEDLDARPEYLSRQFSGKGTWKPNLDTIKEKKVDKKKSHWLF
ncbi:uncharacterized protein LOC117637868 isoform X1 [Prunus dulcis]|uniref:uncharacterized protein LOC117637868 isoform X1 n=1 Tax=Prunus dulcis TaxID=3755 RepID=UPI00148327B7|nr:uncharacterized protein LOC117637868 isoform X1 [Prunus dulcis]